MGYRPVILLALVAVSVCWAEETDESHQPYQELFRSESVYPQQAGEIQLTLSALRTPFGESSRFLVPIGVEYGITDRLQVSFGWENVRAGWDKLGPRYMSVGLKQSFLNLAGTGFLAAVGLEVQSDGVDAFTSWAKDLKGNRAQVFGTFAGEFQRSSDDEDDRSNLLTAGVGFVVLWGSFRYVSEFTLTRSAAGNIADFTPGIIFHAPRECEVGFGVPVRLSRLDLASTPGTPQGAGRVGWIIYFIHEIGPWRNK